jgi:hypothetical protein
VLLVLMLGRGKRRFDFLEGRCCVALISNRNRYFDIKP